MYELNYFLLFESCCRKIVDFCNKPSKYSRFKFVMNTYLTRGDSAEADVLAEDALSKERVENNFEKIDPGGICGTVK